MIDDRPPLSLDSSSITAFFKRFSVLQTQHLWRDLESMFACCTQDEGSATLHVDIPDGDKSAVCFAIMFQYRISSHPTKPGYFSNAVVNSCVFFLGAYEASWICSYRDMLLSVSVITPILESVLTCWRVPLWTRCNTWVGQGAPSACPRSWLSELLGIETLTRDGKVETRCVARSCSFLLWFATTWHDCWTPKTI